MHANEDTEQVWPPAPTILVGETQAYSKRVYLTTVKALDVVVGVVSGLLFQWLADYGLDTGLAYLLRFWYHFPKPSDMWYSVFSSGFVLVCLILIWNRLRLVYKTFANSALWAGVVLPFCPAERNYTAVTQKQVRKIDSD